MRQEGGGGGEERDEETGSGGGGGAESAGPECPADWASTSRQWAAWPNSYMET